MCPASPPFPSSKGNTIKNLEGIGCKDMKMVGFSHLGEGYQGEGWLS
jgi:hypothetical protein